MKEYIWRVNENGDICGGYFLKAKTKEEALEKGRHININYNCAVVMEVVDDEEEQN